ncbi:MAG: hypothetical protein OK456_07770, partial [Thaumarchaeota archaeon]|nr:hypothetical protein [Nitrososphaerota archaeon]
GTLSFAAGGTLLGNGNTTYIGWSASTEKGPSVPFAQMETLYSEAQKATSATSAQTYEAQLDTLYNLYGCTIPILQVANTVGYPSSVTGVVWNSLTDSPVYQNLAT